MTISIDTERAEDARTVPVAAPAADRTAALADRIFGSMLAGAELLSIELGRRLGLYATLFDEGPVTAARFAFAAGIAERYASEWLAQQAAAGILDVVTPGDAATREYLLPAAHVPVLVDESHPQHRTGSPRLFEALALALPAVERAYRSGAGVEYEAFGADLREGIASINRPSFEYLLPSWMDRMPDIAERLREGGFILDAGCGLGWSSIALARRFPAAWIVAVDLDADSISTARRNAEEAGVADRIRFVHGDAAQVARRRSDAPFTLVHVVQALHDMADPVAALRAFREALAPGGAILLGEGAVADEFAAPAGEIERMHAAISALHCVPATMAESDAVAHGTVVRRPTIAAWARAAGFERVEDLPIEHRLYRFVRID